MFPPSSEKGVVMLSNTPFARLSFLLPHLETLSPSHVFRPLFPPPEAISVFCCGHSTSPAESISVNGGGQMKKRDRIRNFARLLRITRHRGHVLGTLHEGNLE